MDFSPFEVYQKLLKHFGKQCWWPAETPFEVVVASILIQRTNWRNAEKAIKRLKEANLLNPSSLAKLEVEDIEALIRSTGFYRQKAERIATLSKHIVASHNGSLDDFFRRPTDEIRKELISLKGIGPETADVILLYAGEKLVLPVSAYARRVFNRLGIRLSNYEEGQEYFVENLPRDLETYKDFHALLVKLGKIYCKTKPSCQNCPLNQGCGKS